MCILPHLLRSASECLSDMFFSPPFFSPSRSPVEKANIKQDCDVGALKASCSSSTEEAVEFKDNSCISKEESRWDSCDSNDPCADNAVEGAEESKGAKKSRLQLKLVENEVDAAYPEPRLPFLCISSLSSKEQKTYLDILMSKKRRDAPEVSTFFP